jgi:hypothetical protein
MITIECNEAAAPAVFLAMAATLPLLGFGVLWIAGVPFRFDVPAHEFNPLVFIPIVASVAGLFFLVAGLFITVRLWRFGRSILTLDREPRVGGHVIGRITSTSDVTPSDDWEVGLRCVETFKDIATSSRVTSSTLTRWQTKSTLPRGQSLKAGVAIDIAVPHDCLVITDPLEQARRTRGRLTWTLWLKGKRGGMDYLASFMIPIPREGSGARPAARG